MRQPESAQDYPRPPAVDTDGGERVLVRVGGRTIAETVAAIRVLETTHPPTYYLPLGAFVTGALQPARDNRRTTCEFKGSATYFDLVVDGTRLSRAAWTYPDPTPAFEALADHAAVMPAVVDGAIHPDDGCYVDGERVQPQDGGFYGGWITSRVAGPFKGAPGTEGW
jgi:uncharacterized protein (DUF427 family)